MKHLSTEAKQQLDWRRSKVLELSSQGYSEREISEVLKVNDTAVHRDLVYKQRDRTSKGDCCFNHIIGLPQKDGHDIPLLPYQRTLYDSLQNHKHIWIKKSRGYRIPSEIYRLVLFREPVHKHEGCIVTGPRIDLVEDLIARFKALLSKNALIFTNHDH